MSEHGGNPPSDVLRTKRLEIVDDEGKARAVLGTNDEGVTSLAIFDQSERLRASLDASEIPEQMNGLAIFDTNGRLQIAMGAHTVSEKGCNIFLGGPDGEPRAGLSVDEKSSGFYCCDINGERRAGFGVNEDGTAGLDFSSAQKDRDIHLQAGAEGDLLFMFSGNEAPMATLGLTEGEGGEPSANLALADKDGQAAAVVSGGRHSDPHLRLLDRRRNVRGSFGLGVGGEAQLIFADAEGRPGREERAFEKAAGERGPMYRVVLFITALVAGGAGGAWIGDAFSATVEPLPAALITVVILASLAVALSVVYRLNL